MRSRTSTVETCNSFLLQVSIYSPILVLAIQVFVSCQNFLYTGVHRDLLLFVFEPQSNVSLLGKTDVKVIV